MSGSMYRRLDTRHRHLCRFPTYVYKPILALDTFLHKTNKARCPKFSLAQVGGSLGKWVHPRRLIFSHSLLVLTSHQQKLS